MLSKATKKYKLQYISLLIFHLMLNILPMTVFTIKAFCESNAVTEKVMLSLMLTVVFILTVVTLINKVVLRSRLWLLLIGLWMCLDSILTVIILIAICQVIDELIVSPLTSRSKNLYTINKEMDKRI